MVTNFPHKLQKFTTALKIQNNLNISMIKVEKLNVAGV